MRRWIWYAIGIALLAVLLMTSDAIPALVDVVSRGRRLSVDTDSPDGVTLTRLDDLLAQAATVVGRPVEEDAYSLARVCRSEEGKASQGAKNLLCHVVCNQAEQLGWTIAYTVQFHKTASRASHYGAQISGRVASGEDPYESDLTVAEYALAERDRGEDPTGGACNFVDTRAFGVQQGSGSFADVVAAWGSEGKRPGTLPGAPSSLVFFWRGSLPSFATPVVT